MKKVWVFVATAWISAAAVLLLPNVLRLGPETAVSRQIHLNEENIVDALAGLPQYVELERVRLGYSVLSIDVSVPEHNLSAEDVYADLWRFCQFGFAETSNMDHVLVRVVERHADRDELLVALRATRDQWREARDEYHNGRQAIPSILQKTFQMKYTEAWRQLTREQTISRATLYDNRFVMI